ncbi:MAG: hypothetical protein Q9214_002437 [Letrouitia sp. 1 TL-2023]
MRARFMLTGAIKHRRQSMNLGSKSSRTAKGSSSAVEQPAFTAAAAYHQSFEVFAATFALGRVGMSATMIRGLGIHETDGLCMKVNDANTVDAELSIRVLACQDGRDDTSSAGSATSDGVEYKVDDGEDLPGNVHAYPSDLQHVDHLHVASCTFCDSKGQALEARTKSIHIHRVG